MPGTFIISFDCEGKWGVADHLTDSINSAFTNEHLNRAYQKLVDMLDQHGVKGTFAFVGAFTMPMEEYHEHKDWFSELEIDGKPWFAAFRQAALLGQFDGWFNPQCLAIVAQGGQHEIAAHGFSHLPLSELIISREAFIREIDLLKRVTNFKDRPEMTFIYPRNLIGYTDELRKAGFIAYRNGIRPAGGIMNKGIFRLKGKIRNILREINLKESAQDHSKPEAIIGIPGGAPLNWRHGLRQNIPISFTIKRWQNIIKDAIRHDKMVHLYTHPHNFITGDRMYFLLDEILKMVSQTLKRKELVNQTQKEYAESFITLKNI